jgi:hypothetical protein
MLVGLLVIAAGGAWVVSHRDEPVTKRPQLAQPGRSMPKSEAVAFRYAFAPGDERTYDLSIDATTTAPAAPQEGSFGFKLTAKMTQKVVEKKKDGSLVLDVTMNDARLIGSPTGAGGTSGSQSVPGFDGEAASMRITISPEGKILGIEGTGGPFAFGSTSGASALGQQGGTSGAESQLLYPAFPSSKVKPGDTWTETSSFKMPFGDTDMVVSSKGRLVGFESSQYGRAARIHFAADAPLHMSFSLDELASAYGEGATVPSGVAGTGRMFMDGGVTMTGYAVVLPDAADLVRLDGTMKSWMRIRLDGVPPQLSAGFPGASDGTINMVMQMSLVRTDAVSART